ncbi:DNA-binding response regulator [Romboutsia weinsteinii]|uniref:Stage 0 sporulation protein A homolog n=1 Tax=Romboutsia weinsteinii TaxID=2020949 RepID=A0A371J448_9FIRM|nr:response regulator transcription factor [Romboutsia weinsteinii]RDY27458.1 DNA-binding response regulator [Romboutsia weinsteinii]
MNILLVSESFIIREALSNLFNNMFEDAFIISISNMRELKSSALINMDFAFLDVHNNSVDQLEVVSEIKEMHNNIKVMILDSSKNKDIFVKSVTLGLDGYILDIGDKDDFIYSVNRILGGKKIYDTDLLPEVLDMGSRNKIEILTMREREVLCLVSEGMNNRQIAGNLHITEYTVKKHVSSIFNKLNLKNRKDAIIYVKDNYKIVNLGQEVEFNSMMQYGKQGAYSF